MPYLNGKRVSLDEWRAGQPVRPMYLYDREGVRVLQNADEVAESEDRESAESWASAENQRRAAGVIFGFRVTPVTAADWPGREDVTSEQVMERRQRVRRGKADDAIADILEVEVTELPAREETVPGDQYTYLAHTKRTGADTAFKAEHPDISTHDPKRRSQRPEGRRERYVRAQAAKHGVTPAQYEREHPLKGSPSSPEEVAE